MRINIINTGLLLIGLTLVFLAVPIVLPHFDRPVEIDENAVALETEKALNSIGWTAVNMVTISVKVR